MNPWAFEHVDAAKRAVWDEDDWEAGVAHCQSMLALVVREGAVVDIGCGVGRLLLPFAAARPDIEWHGIDPTHRMLAHAMAARDELGLTNVAFHQQWPHVTEPWADTVYSVLVFQHLKRLDVVDHLRRARIALKPGARLRFQFVETGDRGPLNHPMPRSTMEAILGNVGFDTVSWEPDPRYPTWTWVTAR